ncbi:suppressor of SWI4 1 homolog [Dermacentor andersoni]|uniref:suppressor of SWI4 1 homolog n=1 Tax=Dermacentor andersoni TaxID=34620 RepID=UPI003B3A5BA8
MGAKKRKGRAVKAAKKGSASVEPEEVSKAPHTFVISRGTLGKNASELMTNFRKVMEPYTASRLQVRRKNVVKDFVSVAGLLHVTHLVVFTKTEKAIYMRLARLPRGPTLTFRVENYALARDIISSLKKPVTYTHQFSSHPLLVLNNFSGEGMHFKLMASMFQNMFPSINIHTVKLNTIRRCLLLNYDSTDQTIDFRHYTIKVAPCGINRAVKKLVQSKVPDLGHLRDISEYIDQGGLSESEAELDGASNQVVLPQKICSRGNVLNQQSSVRMVELGPRMKLKLVKIEEGLMTGEVMYHAFVQRTPEEMKALRERRLELKKLKEKRKQEQEENKRRKEALLEGEQDMNQGSDADAEVESEDDDEQNWYRQEVNEDPDEDDAPPKAKRANKKGSGIVAGKPRMLKRHHNQRSGQSKKGPAALKDKGDGEEQQGDKKAKKHKLSDFEVMMQRRKKRKKLKEKVKEKRLRSQKVAKLRAQQKQDVPFKKVKHKRSR